MERRRQAVVGPFRNCQSQQQQQQQQRQQQQQQRQQQVQQVPHNSTSSTSTAEESVLSLDGILPQHEQQQQQQEQQLQQLSSKDPFGLRLVSLSSLQNIKITIQNAETIVNSYRPNHQHQQQQPRQQPHQQQQQQQTINANPHLENRSTLKVNIQSFKIYKQTKTLCAKRKK